MKLNPTVIAKLQENRLSRLQLCAALGFTELWIDKSIAKNKVNGPLTTATALEVIRKETGLTDSEILESEPAKESQN